MTLKEEKVISRLGHETKHGRLFDTASGLLLDKREQPRGVVSPPISYGEYVEVVPQLQLSLTYACNLECTYCSFRSRMREDGKQLNMRIDIAQRAIEFFIREIVPTTRHARVDFGLTGETFLRHKLHEGLTEFVREKVVGLGLASIAVGPNTTNGTLSETVGIDSNMGPPQDISCDGPQEVHDAVRPFVDGRGSYNELVPVIRKVLERHPDIGVTAVVTSRCTDIVRIFRHLYDDLGFRSLYIKPVNLPPNNPDGLNAMTLKAFCEGYTAFVDFLIAASPDDKLAYISSLNGEDFFKRYFQRVLHRTRNIYRCGAGKSGAYVDTDGKLYPCAHFIGKAGHDIGDILTGFDEERRAIYRELTVDSREPCRSCWGKYVCGGGCYYQAVLTNGDPAQPDAVKCSLVLHLISEAMRLYEHLADAHADVLAAMEMPIHLPEAWRERASEAIYRPVTRAVALGGAAPTIDLMGRDHLEGRRAGTTALELSMAQDGPWLELSLGGAGLTDLDEVTLWIGDLESAPVRMEDLGNWSEELHGIHLHWRAEKQLIRTDWSLKDGLRTVPFKPGVNSEVGAAVQRLGPWSARFNVAALIGRPLTEVGFNLNANLRDRGGCAATARLVRSEPFICLLTSGQGGLEVKVPSWRAPEARKTLNGSAYEGMIALSEWQGRHQNVC